MIDEKISNTGCEVTENNKTENMCYSIDEISGVIEHLEGLINRITGTDTPPCDPKPKPYMALSDIMERGAATINDKCNILHEKINEVEKLLY